MSNIMDFINLRDFPAPPKVRTRRARVTTGFKDATLPPWLRTSRVDPAGLQDVPAGREPLIGWVRNQFAAAGLSWRVADWMVNLIQEGVAPDEAEARLYDHPEFRVRFKPIFDRRAAGQPSITPAEILAWERNVSSMMTAAGMPRQFYDHWTDFQPLITAGWNPQQVGARIEEAFIRVQQSPRPVREAFTELFGPSGDVALAAFTLDPTKALPALQREVATAEVAGAGTTFGFNLNRRQATEIAEAGFDFGTALERFQGLEEIDPLLRETVGETARGEDITFDEGAAAVFGLQGAGEAVSQIRRREEERQAEFSGGGGAQGAPTTGARGLGRERQG